LAAKNNDTGLCSRQKTLKSTQKKIFTGQSPVNPRSALKTPLDDGSLSHFVAPQRQKKPYNAAVKRACNIPLQGVKSLAEATAGADHVISVHQPLQDTRTHILFFACVSCRNKRFLKIQRGQ